VYHASSNCDRAGIQSWFDVSSMILMGYPRFAHPT
jgi:hypothetical protein